MAGSSSLCMLICFWDVFPCEGKLYRWNIDPSEYASKENMMKDSKTQEKKIAIISNFLILVKKWDQRLWKRIS